MIEPAKRLDTVKEYYFSLKLREVRSLMEKGKPIINMGIGSPDLNPPEAIYSAMTVALNSPGAHMYQSYKGRPELRAAMADFYQKSYQVKVNPESEILPMIGSKEAIMHISMAFLNPGDEVLIPNPGYPTYTSVTNLVQARARYYNLTEENNWLPDLQQIQSEGLEKVKMMWINYPHMPTGAIASKKVLKTIIDFARQHNILIVNDNPYSFILNDNPTSILEIEDAMDYAIELNSLSKSFNMAGWRVGMALGNTDHINTILKVKSNMDSGMFYGIQQGAIAALNMGQDWFTELNKIYKERRSLIFKIADKLNCKYDKEATGMFVWAKLPAHIANAEELVDKLLYEHDIFITPGSIFGTNGKAYVRFSLCVNQELIQEALDRL